jgi:hypothetical protein
MRTAATPSSERLLRGLAPHNIAETNSEKRQYERDGQDCGRGATRDAETSDPSRFTRHLLRVDCQWSALQGCSRLVRIHPRWDRLIPCGISQIYRKSING